MPIQLQVLPDSRRSSTCKARKIVLTKQRVLDFSKVSSLDDL